MLHMCSCETSLEDPSAFDSGESVRPVVWNPDDIPDVAFGRVFRYWAMSVSRLVPLEIPVR